MRARSVRALVLVTCAALVTSIATAMDPDSLRVRRQGGDVELSWTDPDPTTFCIVRDAGPPVGTLLGQSPVTTYLDVAPPADRILFYSVDEPLSGSCVVVPPDPLCTPIGRIACGDTRSARNDAPGSTDLVDAYACSAADATGPEIAWTFTAAADARVTATLSGLSADLDVFIVEERGQGCDPFDCIAGGADVVAWDAVTGTTYHVIVDGRLGATSAFTLALTCPPPDPPTCAPIGPVSCGASLSGDTTALGSSNALVDYPSCFSPGRTGREVVYELVPSADDVVTLALSNAPPELEVLVLEDGGTGCATATCVAAGDDGTTVPVTAGQRYFVVVDGRAGVSGAYQLELACGATACQPDASLLCGQAEALHSSWPVSTDVNDAYPCTGYDLSGPEHAYRFTATQDGRATATLSNTTEELDVLILEERLGCSPASCIAWGDTETTFDIVAGMSYDVIVDGRSGVEGFYRLDLACSVPPSACEAQAVMRCGDLSGNDTGLAGRDVIDSWTCAPGRDESGPEYSFQFAPQEDARVRVVLDLAVEDLDLFVVRETGSGCAPAGCIAWGDVEVSFDAVAGTVYYVVVDGHDGASDTFRLWTSCERVAGPCRPSRSISCGSAVTGRNDDPGSTDAIDQYPACIAYPEDGPEMTYELVAASTGDVTAALSNLSTDLDVFVLHDVGTGCVESSCVAHGNNQATFPAVAGERYFIVVEGYAGNAGSYQLTVTCP